LGCSPIGEDCIQVAITVHISKGNDPVLAFIQSRGIRMGAEPTTSIVEIHVLSCVLIGDDDVQVAVAVHIS
jgi:hypothetical protein